MTTTADEVLDDFSDIDLDKVEAVPGPLTGSRGTNKPRGSGTRRISTAAQKKLDALQKRLSGEMFGGGALIGLGLPVTGYYICQESDGFTSAIVQLASKRPEWVEALEHLADIGPGITVGRTVLGMGAALAVDRGRADPEKQAMKFLGVYAAWQAVQQGKERTAGASSNYAPPPAHPFQPV